MEWFLKTFDLSLRDLYVIPLGAVLFWLLISILRKHVFEPFLALLEAREAASTGAAADASAMIADAAEINSDTDAKLTEARVDIMKNRLTEISKAKSDADSKIRSAEQAAQRMLKEGRQKLESQRGQLQARLSADAEAMASSIVTKVLSEQSAPQRQIH